MPDQFLSRLPPTDSSPCKHSPETPQSKRHQSPGHRPPRALHKQRQSGEDLKVKEATHPHQRQGRYGGMIFK